MIADAGQIDDEMASGAQLLLDRVPQAGGGEGVDVALHVYDSLARPVDVRDDGGH